MFFITLLTLLLGDPVMANEASAAEEPITACRQVAHGVAVDNGSLRYCCCWRGWVGKREVSLSLHTDFTDVEVPDLEEVIVPQAFWPLARLFRQHRCAL